ncbi:MAG: EF-P beta-lysylation protein EpmB [Planctomycetales bacterium]|nr:EF-P beta-lysylation protein EpmB [Planctomycetales bacterium]
MPILSPLPGPVGAHSASWQIELREAIRSGEELCRRLRLPAAAASSAAEQDFSVFAPESYVSRMRPGDPADPLLRQVLAVGEETRPVAGFHHDPVGDRAALRQTGLIHKYQGRALLVTTGICAVHCRYCFRRHFPYAEQTAKDMDAALAAIRSDDSIEEVLLSGGDPLTLSDHRIASLVERLAEIGHVRRLRFHSRLPIVIPSRVTSELVDVLRGTRLTTWMVVHANHAREICDQTVAALGRLVDRGVPVLNQAVLLRGVNDSVEAQCELATALVDARVTPYYLHLLDKVAGAAHFDVPESKGQELIQAMRRQLPGYAVPRLVREVPGEPGKRFLA